MSFLEYKVQLGLFSGVPQLDAMKAHINSHPHQALYMRFESQLSVIIHCLSTNDRHSIQPVCVSFLYQRRQTIH